MTVIWEYGIEYEKGDESLPVAVQAAIHVKNGVL
jgi:hypothetical protein